MKYPSLILGASAAAAFGLALALPGHAAEEPVSIIFDSDVDHDCDDIGALFILHGALERGEAKLLATMACASSPAAAPCLDAINTWFGRPDIPVGTLKDEGFLGHSGFAEEIIRRYPRKFESSAEYPDAVKLYRQILAAQPDGSVVVVAVGPLRNIANLLRSAPDAASPLDGRSLVAKKVKRLDVMGGTYPPAANPKEAEWNFKQDPASAALVCSTWPTPVLFNGEGGSTNSGRRVTYEMPEHNPMTMAYRQYPGVGFAGDRLSWDSVSALVAVRGSAPWYEVVEGGTNVTDPATGINTWRSDGGRRHSYLVLEAPKPEVEEALEDMQTAAKGRPAELKFDTAYYADTGMCRIEVQGRRTAGGGWQDDADSSWIVYTHSDGRKRLVTSYVLFCPDADRRPGTVELSGSNDAGKSWTRLDYQNAPGFTGDVTRREFTVSHPAKWESYRVAVTAADPQKGTSIDEVALLESISCRPGIKAADLALDHVALNVAEYGRATLNATVTPADTWDRGVIWASADPGIAEVRKIGEQGAVVVGKKPGTAIISASAGGVDRSCRVTVTPSALPAGWRYDELNAPPIPGSVGVDGGRFALAGCGHAMTSWWERVRDQGTFVSRALGGEGAISARLAALSPNVGGPGYKWDNRPPTVAGLMVRESLEERCDRYFLIQVEATGGLVCRWRNKTGDQDDNQKKELGEVTLPVHLKLVQNGGEIQVFTSADGEDWGSPRFSHNTTFGEGGRKGLFVCSGNTFVSATAVFDSVREAR